MRKKVPDLSRYSGRRWYLKNKAIDEYSASDLPWVNQLHSSKFIVSIVAFTETFQCPICYATGTNALADCDSHIKHEVCNRHMPMCKISKKLTFSGRVRVTRHCSDKQAQDDLEQKPKCAKCPQYGFCAESLCMAHLPGTIRLFSNCLVQGFCASSSYLTYIATQRCLSPGYDGSLRLDVRENLVNPFRSVNYPVCNER